MFVSNILRTKGTTIHTISPDATADDAVLALVKYNIGSLVVREADAGDATKMLGIVTERDILRAQAAHRKPLDALLVREIMSTNLIVTSLEDKLQNAMRLMTEHRIRHLPVVDKGTLIGIISIGDVVKAHHDELEMENHHMKSYIQGEAADVGVPL
ncbi:MAG: CBS domain-containing protein [Planctomycetia bacterium]|nr:CBS domain-containing protein [Planctomycetia bacterium]